MEPKYEFKKLGENKFAFVLSTDSFVRTEEISKETARETYRNARTERQKYQDQLNHTRADLEKLEYGEPDPEVTKLMDLLSKVELHKRYFQLKSAMDVNSAMLEKIDQQIDDMESVIPEFKRLKK